MSGFPARPIRPVIEDCTVYHCPGDCGNAHSQAERISYLNLVMAEFDKQSRQAGAPAREALAKTRRKAKKAL